MLTLASDGHTDYAIIVEMEASLSTRRAAAELSSHLEEATGAEFVLIPPNKTGDRPVIVVGPEAAASIGFAEYEFDGLGDEGVRIRAVGDHLVLTGGRGAPRGTLYAVYTFLEEIVGCRWWSSKVSHIPKRERLEIPPPDIRYVPPLEYRESFWYDAFDGDWAVRNKSNGNRVETDEARGGHHVYKGFVHTFYPLVPPEQHFGDHPEWYSEIDGKRTYDRAQLCLTNESLRDFVIERAREWLRESPDATIISISQNDWHGYCQCESCRAVDEEEGSQSGTMLRFVNAVAEALEEEFPRVAFSTLAYQYTRQPPKLVKPRDNVIVRLCSIECNFLEPLTHDSNRAFREDIEGWSNICDRLYIWDYTTNFRNYVQPHPNWRVLGDNIRFFAANGVRGVFEQGAYQSYGSEMAELRAWVLAKLLWKPKLDERALIREFLDGYYGRAAAHIDAYMRSVYDNARETDTYLRCFMPNDAAFLTPDLLLEALRHFEAARLAVEGDEALRQRVETARLPVEYVCLMRWSEVRARATATGQAWLLPNDPDEAFDAFAAVYEANAMTHLAEWGQHDLNWMKGAMRAE